MIEIWTEVLPDGWAWKPDNYLGGTPEFYVNTAENIDDDVIVYYDGVATEHNGVTYLPRSMYNGIDVVISCNSISPKLGKHNIYWSNWVHMKDEDVLFFDERIVLSPYHQSIFGDNSRIVPHSCIKKEFENPVKIKKQCLYSSSPDRGYDFIKSIWDDVEKETGATLICTYDKRISDKEMVELYKSSEYWLHPGQGVELFCIAAAKAQTAKCIPVVVPNMALDTTVKYGVKTTIENYKKDLIDAINNTPEIKDVDFGSWESVTQDLLRNI